jgi:hypothetical protein
MEALVKWTGYSEPSWEPLNEIQGVSALDDYERTYGSVHDDNEMEQTTVRVSFLRPPPPEQSEEGGGE